MGSKKKLAQLFTILIIVSVCLVLAGGIWKGRFRPVHKEVQQAPAADAEMKLKDMEFTEMQNGRRFWTLCASEAKYFQEQQKTRLLAVRLTLYLDKTDEQIFLVSKEGVLHAGSKDIELIGNIRVKLPRDYMLTTEKAYYTHNSRMVESDTPVHLSGPGIELDGNRWKYNISDHVARVDGKVTAYLVAGDLRIDK